MTTSYDRTYFFDVIRANLFRGALSQSQVDGLNYILGEWERHFPYKPKTHLAYTLATVFHETDQTMRPIEEYGKGRGYRYGQAVGIYKKIYYGRGHVQLTWEENYRKATQKIKAYGLTVDLHKHPEKMLEDEISVIVLFDGMGDGWYTGKRLSDYFSGSVEDPRNARRIVNGLDKADLIALYYRKFMDSLEPIPEVEQAHHVGPQMPEPSAADLEEPAPDEA